MAGQNVWNRIRGFHPDASGYSGRLSPWPLPFRRNSGRALRWHRSPGHFEMYKVRLHDGSLGRLGSKLQPE